MMDDDAIDKVAHEAVMAALKVLDRATAGKSKRSAGPLGDEFAYTLDARIQAALREMYRQPEPAGS